jgi:hypothetical protein
LRGDAADLQTDEHGLENWRSDAEVVARDHGLLDSESIFCILIAREAFDCGIRDKDGDVAIGATNSVVLEDAKDCRGSRELRGGFHGQESSIDVVGGIFIVAK